jgi:hypothetical protein
MNQRRRAGKLGRKMGVSETGSRFKLAAYQTDPFPPDAGQPLDFTSGVVAWGMLGNDTYGDCGVAGDVHADMANAWYAGEQPPGNIAAACWPSADQVVQTYLSYTGGQDSGVDLGEWLLWRCTHSIGPLGPIGGFAQVSVNAPEYGQALAAFGVLYTGVNLCQEAMDEFNQGLPWTSVATDWIGGHCVPHVARSAQWGRLITWSDDQLFSWPWWEAAGEEAYVIFTPAQMAAPGGGFNGVNVAQLKADIQALGGTLTPPEPAPTPTPGGGCAIPFLGKGHQ